MPTREEVLGFLDQLDGYVQVDMVTESDDMAIEAISKLRDYIRLDMTDLDFAPESPLWKE